MARRTAADEDWDDEDWDGEDGDDAGTADGRSADDADEERDEATAPCPYCGRPIYEDTPRCPHCENYLTDEEAAPTRKPWWILLGVGLCLYLVYRWTVGR